MGNDCCTSGGDNIMILACSGASNVGQLANRAAVELTQEGFGKFFCLAGVGGHLSGFVQPTRDVPAKVVIDGCSVGCARAILAHMEIPLENYLIVTELGIGKNKDFNLKEEDLNKLKDTVRSCLPGNCCCGQ